MGNLFDLFDAGPRPSVPLANDTWRPDAPPDLTGVKKIYLNFETTGLRWFDRDKPIAVSLYAKDRSWYLPWGHVGAANLQEEQVKRWMQREVRDKHIVNINTRFEVHNAREWGVDLERQGNTVSDVAHYSALLDDHRYRNNLDALIQEFLNEAPMPRLDESRMASYPAGLAAPRAMYNVESVMRLEQAMWPMLDEQGLQRVRQLEDDVIFAVCEMEKNGAIIDMELLHLWIKESLEEYHRGVMDLYRESGLRVNPSSSQDVAKLFHKLGLPIEEYTAPSRKHPHGQPSFKDEYLKGIQHPIIKRLRYTKKVKGIHNWMVGVRDSLDDHGILRYALHQLRASKSGDEGNDESGTVTGRFTSTEIVEGVGINAQQVRKPEKQFHSFGDAFFVRNLFIPPEGKVYISSDAEQIQYRIAAAKAGNPKVLEAYKKDPKASFHRMAHAMFRPFVPHLTYGRTKDANFAKLFAAGIKKIALMMNMISNKQFLELTKQRANRNHPLLKQAGEILAIYKREMPEMDALLKEYTQLYESQGFVTSLLGRRMRYDGTRAHKGLNMFIQASEADIVKTKMVQLHRAKDEIGFTPVTQVHDELNGYGESEETAKRVDEILNVQSFPEIQIPILWGTKTSWKSWGDCAREELAKLRAEAA